MKYFNSIVIGFMALAIILGCSQKATSQENAKGKVVAEIGDVKITETDIKNEIENLPQQFKSALNSDEKKKQYIEFVIIPREMMYLEAKATGVENDEKVKKTMEQLKKKVLVEAFLRQYGDKISDKEVKDYFKKNEKSFEEPEKIHVKHILVKDKKVAEDILAKIKKDAGKFEELAKEFSVDSSGKNGGDLGAIEKNMLIPEFTKATDKLSKAGEISPIVKTEYGYHIIKFISREKGKSQKFDDVKDEVKDEYFKNVKYEELVKSLKKKYKVKFEGGNAEKKEDAPKK